MLGELAPTQIPDGEVYVLGDNRNNSEDSLAWGHGAPLKDVIGRVRYIYSPASRMGPVASYPLRNVSGH